MRISSYGGRRVRANYRHKGLALLGRQSRFVKEAGQQGSVLESRQFGTGIPGLGACGCSPRASGRWTRAPEGRTDAPPRWTRARPALPQRAAKLDAHVAKTDAGAGMNFARCDRHRRVPRESGRARVQPTGARGEGRDAWVQGRDTDAHRGIRHRGSRIPRRGARPWGPISPQAGDQGRHSNDGAQPRF
jgi:hypothetical protein